ncbi:unnamed protein product, partial [Musa banksii]
MKLKLIEPLKFLFKDEVQKLGSILNVPESFLKRPIPWTWPCYSCTGGCHRRKCLRDSPPG